MTRDGRASGKQPNARALSGQIDGVRTLYDRWAAVYDWNPVLALVRPARRRAVDAMDVARGDTVVDMGTGTGANLPLLRDAVGKTGRVVGIDASNGMIAKARTRIEEHGWDNVSVLEGDIRDPPVDGPVDGICSAFVAVMYEDPRTLLEPWADLVDDGAMAHIYSGPRRRGYAPAVNGVLRGYLWLFDEGWEMADDRTPVEILARRGERVRNAMADLSDSASHDELVLGLVKLDVGRF
ncbi:MAG: class I SAM-dependent methyltransferase [Halanaeroarchaeum sp.]